MYAERVERLNAWLRLGEDEKIGYPVRRMVKKKNTLDVGLKNKHLSSLNKAKKCQLWYVELRNILQRRQDEAEVPQRAWQLYDLICRMPWRDWGVIWDERMRRQRTVERLEELITWMNAQWPTMYEKFLLSQRHTLLSWRLAMEDSERTGRLRQISRWLRPRHFIPSIQQEDGSFEGSPIKVAHQLQEAWGRIAQPSSKPLLTDEVMQQMTARLRRQPWTPLQMDPEDLRRTVQGKGDSAMGPDRIPWKVLSALPLEGWRRLVQVLEVIEATGIWPTPLLAISLVPVPKLRIRGLLDRRKCG